MDADEARATLQESARRREQTIEAGTAGWSWPTALGIAGSLIGLGIALDLEMIWLVALMAMIFAGSLTAGAVRLRRTRAVRRWDAAVLASWVGVLAFDIVVQAVVRALGGPAPNTLGAVGGALIVLLVCRPVHARAVRSLRP